MDCAWQVAQEGNFVIVGGMNCDYVQGK